MPYFIGHDLGTGGNKAALVDDNGRVLAVAFAPYALTHPHPSWAEQDPAAWWEAVVACTREVVRASGVDAAQIHAISFAGQMLALVGMDAKGKATRPAISWLDHRAESEVRRMIRRLGGARFLSAVAGVLPTAKDIVAKLAWIRKNEPDIYRATAAFADATSYLLARASGEIAFDHTGAAATGLLDAPTRTWSKTLALLTGTSLRKFPPLRRCAEVVGPLTTTAAAELGLTSQTRVTVGMADIPAAALGAGAVENGDAHIYLGTSSWLGVMIAKPLQLPRYGIASVAAPDPALCLLIAESETAGACIDWFARLLDGEKAEFTEVGRAAAQAPPGSRGLLFLPWLFGERSPVPNPNLRGGFVNLSLEHRRADMCRAIYEGVAFNLRWTLEAVAAVGLPCPVLRAIGGGALSDLWLQIIADISGRRIERMSAPQHAGARGCALAAAVAVGSLPNLAAIKPCIAVERVFLPEPSVGPLYDTQYAQFRTLYAPLAALAAKQSSH